MQQRALQHDSGVVAPAFDLHERCPQDHPGPSGIQKCRQVFVNVGIHPFVAGWNLSEYRMGLEQLMLQLGSFSSRQGHHVPIVFISTPLSPIHKNMTECPLSPSKARLPHLVMEYNLMAREVVGRSKSWLQWLRTTSDTADVIDNSSRMIGEGQGVRGTLMRYLTELYMCLPPFPLPPAASC